MALRNSLCSMLIVSAVTACNCGTDTLQRNGNTTLTIDSPKQGDNFAPTDSIDFHATAHNIAGVKEVVLAIGQKQLTTCKVVDDPTTILCDGKFKAKDYLLVQGQLTLIASSIDTKVPSSGMPSTNKAQITINISALAIRFLAPAITQANPPLAAVSGMDPVAVAVTSASPLQRVSITYDNNVKLTSWPGTNTTFSNPISWAKTMGTGVHHLVAQAQDMNGNVNSAKLDVEVGCTADSECSSGNRCCVVQKTCNPIVSPGSDCDCEHPCPLDQGCFPGTCDAAPLKCRPGCNPGDQTHVADACAPETDSTGMHTTYCTNLPAGSATVQNKGGACAPSDDCDVVKQNCPPFPLDRTRPVSASNPAVPHTCVPASPASPKANACLPAGNTKPLGTGCDLACGNDTTNCSRGLICVTPVDSTGTATGPAACQNQCSTPWMGDPSNPFATPSQAPDCSPNQYCGGLQGNGGAAFATGVCQPIH